MASRRNRRAAVRTGSGRPSVGRPKRRLSYYFLVAISVIVALSMILPTCAPTLP